jgi:cellulose synthase/poly-beta-1,6-N-acetylglucosamine synthase-like glycosyltransferase
MAAFLVVYPYAIYPLLLHFVNKLRYVTPSLTSLDSTQPSVTLIVSAYNEQEIIADKISNCLQLEYPAHLINIVVVSDASDDATDSIVSEWASRISRVRLHRQAERRGKSAGITAVMSTIDSDLVVFSDANAMYEDDAIHQLVRCFDNVRVGYVVGSALYYDDQEDAVKDSEGLYWKYELWVKGLESRFFSVVGGDGAIYAIRRELFWPLHENDISDFVNPLQIVAHGYTGVFTKEARCHEYASDEFSREFMRKRRIVNRSWRAVCSYIGLLPPRAHGLFLFMLISHKVIRWLSLPFIAISIAACGLLLLTEFSWLYAFLLALIMTSVALALIGKQFDERGRDMPRIVYLPYYFYFVSTASVLGIWDNLRGVQHVTWDHIRS